MWKIRIIDSLSEIKNNLLSPEEVRIKLYFNQLPPSFSILYDEFRFDKELLKKLEKYNVEILVYRGDISSLLSLSKLSENIDWQNISFSPYHFLTIPFNERVRIFNLIYPHIKYFKFDLRKLVWIKNVNELAKIDLYYENRIDILNYALFHIPSPFILNERKEREDKKLEVDRKLEMDRELRAKNEKKEQKETNKKSKEKQTKLKFGKVSI